jgi:hypothetical protein
VNLKYLFPIIVGILDMIFNLLFALMNDLATFVHLYHHVVNVLHRIQVPHAILFVQNCEVL